MRVLVIYNNIHWILNFYHRIKLKLKKKIEEKTLLLHIFSFFPNSTSRVLASITAWYNFRLVPSDATNNALGDY